MIDYIKDNACKFNLFQLLRIFKSLDLNPTIKPKSSLEFPASDVYACNFNVHDVNEIVVRYFGMQGVDSPLPSYMYQVAAQDSEDGSIFREFLNIFNKRAYELLFDAWQKHKLLVEYDCTRENSQYLKYLTAFSGAKIDSNDELLFSYSAIFGAKCQNIYILGQIISSYLEGVAVKVDECIGSWMTPGNVGNLGNNYELGSNALLGKRIFDGNSRVKIIVGPIGLNNFNKLLPGKVEGFKLIELCRKYVGETLDFDLEFIVSYSDDDRANILGEDTTILGLCANLGARDSSIQARFKFNENTYLLC